MRQHIVRYTSNGTHTVPAGVFRMRCRLQGPGGGGGGGSRGNSTNSDNQLTFGGAGGGAGELVDVEVDVFPGDVLTHALGAAGTGGAGSGSGVGSIGGTGTEATIVNTTQTEDIARAKPGLGGSAGARNIATTDAAYSIGGLSSYPDSIPSAFVLPGSFNAAGLPSITPATVPIEHAYLDTALRFAGPGCGSSIGTTPSITAPLRVGWPCKGGDLAANGTDGTDDGSKRGGFGGCGGGGHVTPGGAGGNGGNAVAGGSGTAGTAGANATSASGNGGGGGGSGGTGSSGGAGAAGGNGALGYAEYIW